MGSSQQTFRQSSCGIDGCDQHGYKGITVGNGKGPPLGYMGGFYCSQEHIDLAEAQLKAQAAKDREAYDTLRDRLDGRLPVLFMSKRKARAALSWLSRTSSGW